MADLTLCRLLIDPPAPGPWNMAVDQVLLESAIEHGVCWWRFYRWSQPTLSLGYFQPYADRLQHPPSQGCPAVRRLTGGGAIVHHAELTYSVVVPGNHPLAARRNVLYQTVHGSLIRVLADWDVTAKLCCESAPGPQKPQPLLCFRRRAPGDVVVGTVKIAGSAQRRSHGAVLQHGSVLLRRSPAAPELAALKDLAQTAIAEDQLADAWLREVSAYLGLDGRHHRLSDRQRCRAAVLVDTRYSAAHWTRSR